MKMTYRTLGAHTLVQTFVEDNKGDLVKVGARVFWTKEWERIKPNVTIELENEKGKSFFSPSRLSEQQEESEEFRLDG